jgi:hypothetical protein
MFQSFSNLTARRAAAGMLAAAATVAAGLAAAGPAQAAGPAHHTSAQPAATRPHAGARSPRSAPRAAGATLVVTTLRSGGPGSLRTAIRRSRRYGGRPVIRFAVAGTITLARALPAITSPVRIDGRSAPGYRPGGPPVVGIDCAGHTGLRLAAGARGASLLGLAVTRASEAGVTLKAPSVTLDADYLGVTVAGTPGGNRGDGLYVSPASSGDQIGRNPSGTAGLTADVISGNGGNGITLDGSSGDTIVANRIGTSPTGTTAMANGGAGLAITGGSSGNQIGGRDFIDPATGQANNPTGSKGTVTPVFVVPPLGNQISGNSGDGVQIAGGSRRNSLNGNFIGTTADGDAALGNRGDGVRIDHSDGNSLTGCKFVNNPFVYYNVISGNHRNGLRVTDSAGTVVQGNFFGTGADNTTTVRNRRDGILVGGSSANTQVGGVIPLGNVSAGNGRDGIAVTGRVHGFITFNTFGGLLAFKGAAPNGRDGLLITSSGGSNTVRTNVFSGNDGNGIELAGHATGVTIDPNIAGLTTNGGSPLPNGGDGLLIHGQAHDNVVGGTTRSVIPQNTFSGNAGYGIAITGRAYRNQVLDTFVGTKILGLKRLGNGRGGVLIGGRARANLIGALSPLPVNLISGNSGIGVTLRRHTSGNGVIGNYIGLDRRGHPLPNLGRAVVDRGRGNVIRRNREQP